MSEYEAQANTFLTTHGLTLKVAYQGKKSPPWSDDAQRDRSGCHYRVTIKRKGGRSISFDFWGSIADMEAGKPPSAYSVLACIGSDIYTPDTFEDFCGEYGYDLDSRKAEQTFKKADAFAQKLRSFFTEQQEVEALSEIR